MEDISREKFLVTSFLEAGSYKFTQGNPLWPFAHLGDALGGIHTAKQNVLMQDGRNPDSRQVFEGEKSNFKSFSDDAREPMKVSKQLSLNSEMKGFEDQEVFRKSVNKHVVQEIVKGVYVLSGTSSECLTVKECPSRIESAKSIEARGGQNLGVQLGKALPPDTLSVSNLERGRRQGISRKEPLEPSWEYAFTSEPVPVVATGKSFLSLLSNHGLQRGGLIHTNKLTLRKLPLHLTEKHTSVSIKMMKIDGLPKALNNPAQSSKESKRKHKGQTMRILKQLVCGGFAGVVSRTAVAPLDLIKTYLITSHCLRGSRKSAVTICKDIIEQDGWQGLFRGNLVNCLRVAPSKAIELCVFETVRRALNREGHPLKHMAATIAGGAAGMAGTIVTYPLELLRTRLSVQPELYSGLLQAFRKIAQDEGFMAFYSGLSPSLVGAFPYAATNYFVYDGLRTAYCRSTGERNVPTLPTLVFGAVAAAASSAVTYPLEVARRQMQLCLTGPLVKESTIGVILDVYQHEGFLALYRGLGTTWLKLIPAAGISFVCYETARLAFQIDDASLVRPEETIIAEQEA